jgi:hypothetical protein
MRALFPTLAVLACPVGMCLIPMVLARRKGKRPGRAMGDREQPEPDRTATGLGSETGA